MHTNHTAPRPERSTNSRAAVAAWLIVATAILVIAPVLVVTTESAAPGAAPAPAADEPVAERVLPIGYGG